MQNAPLAPFGIGLLQYLPESPQTPVFPPKICFFFGWGLLLGHRGTWWDVRGGRDGDACLEKLEGHAGSLGSDLFPADRRATRNPKRRKRRRKRRNIRKRRRRTNITRRMLPRRLLILLRSRMRGRCAGMKALVVGRAMKDLEPQGPGWHQAASSAPPAFPKSLFHPQNWLVGVPAVT